MYLRIPIALQYCGSLINTIFVSELYKILYVTRMTIFIKTKFKISDDQTNIDKYRLTANITVYHILSI